MPKKLQDLTWQEDYKKEYTRTSGNTMTFSAVEPGGWYTITTSNDTNPAKNYSRIRRGLALENTARLRMREDYITPDQPHPGSQSGPKGVVNSF